MFRVSHFCPSHWLPERMTRSAHFDSVAIAPRTPEPGPRAVDISYIGKNQMTWMAMCYVENESRHFGQRRNNNPAFVTIKIHTMVGS